MKRTFPVAPMLLAVVAGLIAGHLHLAVARAQHGENPAWLVADVAYAGVWKTEGANPASDLDSQITFGFTGADGSMVLVQDDKIAIRYGIYPVGAPNHSVTNVLATRTPDGFKWGHFDPSRNSAEFTFTVDEDGRTLRGARHAMFNGREYFNNIEMTRVEPEPPAQSQQAPERASCALNERFKPESGQTGKPFSEMVAAPPPSESMTPYIGAWEGEINGEMVRLVVFPTNRLQYVWAGMGDGEDANAYRTYQITADATMTWSSGSEITYAAERQDDGSLSLQMERAGEPSGDGMLAACGV